MRASLVVAALCIMYCTKLFANTTDVEIEPKIDTVFFQPAPDSLKTALVTNPTDFEKHLAQNPTVALFKSMLVPGLGQIGNGRYVKAAVIIGLETWFIGSVIHYGRQASDYRRQWNAAADAPTRNIYYGLYEDRRDERNKFTWFAGITIFISMFDAYVDAHLSGSPHSESNRGISWDVTPNANGGASAVLTYSF